MLRPIFTLLALALAVLVAANDLKIDVTYKPDSCGLKSRKGDKMSMQ